MLTQLATIKSRLALTVTTYDDILTSAIKGISVRFDKECNRTFARTEGIVEEFSGADTEVAVPCYPIETVTKFELKSTEAEGWVEQTSIDFLIRRNCVISLTQPFYASRSTLHAPQYRVTYTVAYVLPGTTPSAGQTPLPDDLEQAAIEQVSPWFLTRNMLGLVRNRPWQGNDQVFAPWHQLLKVS